MTGTKEQPKIYLLYHDDPECGCEENNSWEAIYVNGKLVADCEGMFSASRVLGILAEFNLINFDGTCHTGLTEPRKDVTP